MICNASTPLFMFDVTTMNTVFKGAICSFGTEIQTQKGQIYTINKLVLIQTHIFIHLFDICIVDIINKPSLEEKEGPQHTGLS